MKQTSLNYLSNSKEIPQRNRYSRPIHVYIYIYIRSLIKIFFFFFSLDRNNDVDDDVDNSQLRGGQNPIDEVENKNHKNKRNYFKALNSSITIRNQKKLICSNRDSFFSLIYMLCLLQGDSRARE